MCVYMINKNLISKRGVNWLVMMILMMMMMMMMMIKELLQSCDSCRSQ